MRSMKHVWKLHGFHVVVLLYLTKVPLIRRLLKNTVVKTNILGNTMYLNVVDGGLHRRLLLSGIREEEHTKQIQQNIKPGMRGIDLGANVGYFALMEASLVGDSGRVYCIEPEPKNLRLLHKNISANGLGGIMSVSGCLVGDHNSTERLYLSEFGNVHSVSSARNTKGFVEVPMVTLDHFMDQHELRPEDIDFIRMDIEGYEVMAFQGMKKLMESKTPFKIFMEFHPMYYSEWGWTFEKLLIYLESCGFRVKDIAQGRHTLQNPSIQEVLQMRYGEGSQAYLERV